MVNRHWILAALAGALVAVAGLSAAQAGGPNRNYLTFSGTVALPGATLPPGTYVFDVVVPGGPGDVVSVSSRDGRHYFLGFTRDVARPRGLRPSATVTFGEAPPGNPPRIAVWYPLGGSTGHQFIYADGR